MEVITHKKDIVEYKNFFTKEECQELIEHFNSSEELWEDTCFYNSAVMFPLAPKNSPHPHINEEYFNNLKLRLKEISETVFGKPVKNLTLSAHKWNPGAFAGDHYDNAELDKTPNAWQENKFVTIIYLNDNYEGGELTFSEHGLAIAPSEGSMIVFDVGVENLHGVNEILSGVRYTMLLSWDFEDSVYPEGFYDIRDKEKQELEAMREEQRQEWAKGNKYA